MSLLCQKSLGVYYFQRKPFLFSLIGRTGTAAAIELNDLAQVTGQTGGQITGTAVLSEGSRVYGHLAIFEDAA